MTDDYSELEHHRSNILANAKALYGSTLTYDVLIFQPFARWSPNENSRHPVQHRQPTAHLISYKIGSREAHVLKFGHGKSEKDALRHLYDQVHGLLVENMLKSQGRDMEKKERNLWGALMSRIDNGAKVDDEKEGGKVVVAEKA